MIVECTLTGDTHLTCAMLVPTENFLSRQIVVPGLIVDPSNEKTPIRLLNPGPSDITLYKGTVVASFEGLSAADITAPLTDGGYQPDHTSSVCTTNDCDIDLPEHLQPLYDDTALKLNPDQRCKLKSLLFRFQDTFAVDKSDLGKTKTVQHEIKTGDAKPIKQMPRRLPLSLRPEAEAEIQRMLSQGIIEPSDSPWASPVVLVRKRDGTVRFCLDYRRLNDVTVKDSYPIPRIDESLDALGGSNWFSTLDLASGYWQVMVKPEDKP